MLNQANSIQISKLSLKSYYFLFQETNNCYHIIVIPFLRRYQFMRNRRYFIVLDTKFGIFDNILDAKVSYFKFYS